LGKTETITYKVGDTVMVETDTLYIMKRPPSIGVIVAMWETRKEEDSDTLTDASRMRIRIHWFLRPTELASIRAKREHQDVSYYLVAIENKN
jgi:origin recognition complex subunit 1